MSIPALAKGVETMSTADTGKILQPVLLVKPGTVSREDIERAGIHGGICIVECSDPEAARFVEPPEPLSSLDDQARAAMWLLRRVVEHTGPGGFTQGDLTKWFISALMDGRRPEPTPSVPRVAGPAKR